MTIGTLQIKTKKNKKGNQVKTIEFYYNSPTRGYRSLGFSSIAQEEISSDLAKKIQELESGQIKVEFEEDGDQIKQIREEGQPWIGVVEQVAPYDFPSGDVTETPRNVNPQNFHNPYNFVPALPRDQVTGDLGDHSPVGHSYYHADKFSGRISVKLTTVTPLLIPDASKEEEDNHTQHKTYPVRVGADGKPYLPPTSIKGMLRSAYEAVTNSRLAVFEDHDSRLAYRMPATMGLEMVPARIEGDQIVLYPGTSQIGQNGKPRPGDPMYAAWLPRYAFNTVQLQNEVRYPNRNLPEHGQHVRFWAEKIAKLRNGNQIFTYWKVRSIVLYTQQLGQRPNPSQPTQRNTPVGEPMQQFEGYVYINRKNIDRKHDERVFIANFNAIHLNLSNDLRKKWNELITNYQEIHEKEINQGQQAPPALNNAEWSRHITTNNQTLNTAERNLQNGTLCYAHVRQQGSSYKVLNLYPVMITRGLYEMPPTELLQTKLKPATQKDQLSPADRVFGWVNQKGNGSYKGQLRIHSVTCQCNNAIDDFGSAQAQVPLAILGQPKPEQSHFYGAKNQKGEALDNGSAKAEGYKNQNQGLRGRKVYPHHKGLPNGYWNDPTEDRTQQAMQGHYQEYRRPQNNGAEQQDDQNRSIKGWVKPGAEFTFDIDITNLSDVELGALLWLLALPDLHFHRLGGGKPLGFGSVRLDLNLEKTDLRSGKHLQDYYGSLLPTEHPDCQPVISACINAFKNIVKQDYAGSSFDRVPFIAAFCNAAQGFNDNAAIHYPRTEQAPHPEGKAFEWFVANENDTREELGLKLSLANLSDAQPASFPIHPKRPNERQQNHNRPNSRRR